MQGYNFTNSVREALANSRNEAAQLRHEYVGTEHILLGLTRSAGVAESIFRGLAVDPAAIRNKVHEVVKTGHTSGALNFDLPYTSRAKKVLELAMAEAREFGHAYVGTEHLFLGVVREEKGIAAQVLMEAGVTLDATRAEVRRIVGGDAGARTPHARSKRLPWAWPTHIRVHNAPLGIFWLVLGLVVLVESVRAMLSVPWNATGATRHVPALAGIEAVAAALFLIPRTMRVGAWVLLAVFTLAMGIHMVRGEFPGALLVYAAGVVLVLRSRSA